MSISAEARFGIQEIYSIQQKLEKEGIMLSSYHSGGITLEQIDLDTALYILQLLPSKLVDNVLTISINRQELLRQTRDIPRYSTLREEPEE